MSSLKTTEQTNLPLTNLVIGSKVNKLTITRILKGSHGKMYKTLCHCGKETIFPASTIEQNRVKTCGCMNYSEHRARKSPELLAWVNLRQRCMGRTSDSKGEVGIPLSKELETDFEGFLLHLGLCPDTEQEWTLARITKDLNYRLGNIQWVTVKSILDSKEDQSEKACQSA